VFAAGYFLLPVPCSASWSLSAAISAARACCARVHSLALVLSLACVLVSSRAGCASRVLHCCLHDYCPWKTPRGYLPCLSTATRLLTAWRPPAVLLRLGCRSHRALHACLRRVAPFMLALQHLCWPPASCLLSVSVPWRSHSSPSSDRCLSLSRCPAVSTACMLSACCIFRTPVQAPASLRSCSSHSQACCLFTLECHRPYPHTYPCMRHPRACLACVIPCL